MNLIKEYSCLVSLYFKIISKILDENQVRGLCRFHYNLKLLLFKPILTLL